MLDPVMGVLFILGLAYALWRWRDPPNLLMLLILVIMLQGGILTLDFEAPQSLRSIGVIPALVYFMTLPCALVSRTIDDLFARRTVSNQPAAESGAARSSPTLAAIPANVVLLSLLAVVTYLNFELFFDKQKNDQGVWSAYSTSETLVANEMNRLAADYDFILAAIYENHPTVQFLAGTIANRQRWTVTDHLPLVRSADRGAVLLFDETLLSAYKEAKRLYPAATFTEYHPPTSDNTILWEVILTPEVLRMTSGVSARYFAGDAVGERPVKQEALAQAAVDWTKAQPIATPFVAEISSTLYVQEYGDYRFSVRGAPEAALWIDENPVGEAPLKLARGNHALRMHLPGGAYAAQLWWQQPNSPEEQLVPSTNLFRAPVRNSGLLGTYYASPDWSGEPAFEQIDPEIAYYFHVIPLQRPYSVEWKGKLFAPTAGAYRMALESIDGSQLRIDDRVVVDNPNGHTTIEGDAELAQGWHDIDIRFSDQTSGTRIYLYWTPPGASEREIVPSRYLSPPMGRYPTSPDAQQ